jgi:hypothetical protein
MIMMDKSIFNSEQSLANILNSAFFAGDCINEVGATARDFAHALKILTGNMACDVSSFVEVWAISAISSIAE